MHKTNNRPEIGTDAGNNLPNYYGEFVQWEKSTTGVKLRREVVDAVDDLTAAILLNQILFWYMPGKDGRPKLRVFKEGQYWLAKSREDYWEECRLSVRQVDRAIELLEAKGFLKTRVFKFGKTPKMHVAVELEKFLAQLQSAASIKTSAEAAVRGEDDSSSGQVDCDKSVTCYTESTLKENLKEKNTTEHSADSSFFFCDGLRAEFIADFLPRWYAARPDVDISADQKELLDDVAWVGVRLNLRLDFFLEVLVVLAVRVSSLKTFTAFCQWVKDFMPEYAQGLNLLGAELSPEPDKSAVSMAGFIHRWKKNYAEFHGRQGEITAEDRNAIAQFLRRNPSGNIFELLDLAYYCWERDQETPPPSSGFDKYWACRQAWAIRHFFKQLERIRREQRWDS